MFQYAIRLVELIAVLGTCSALAYYVLCIWSASKWQSDAETGLSNPGEFPAISILKPLKGADSGLLEALRSHCLQNYPQYEIIFGVSDDADPAIDVINRLTKEFPQNNIQVHLCSEILGTNVKVSNLVQMLPQARHNILIVNDGDILVPQDYLQLIATGLTNPKVGLVTCLYRARAGQTLASRLEALGISTDFSAGVLVARELEGGLRFGLGSTLAFRKSDLHSIGGFESLLEYLADDYQLGVKIAKKGLNVKLSKAVVDTFVPAYSFAEFVQHQLRWARTIRDSRPWGYFGLVTTFGVWWASLTVLFTRGALWAWLLFAVTLLLRISMALAVGAGVLRDSQAVSFMWLIPLRDLLAVFVWIGSFFGNTVRWRGDKFRLHKGRLLRMND